MAGDPGFWDVAWNWPLPFVTAVLAVPMARIIWFICQLRYKQQIATLKDRPTSAARRWSCHRPISASLSPKKPNYL
jgi:hypothetical protein